jgi:N-acylneuraminate cytidylyltransferase
MKPIVIIPARGGSKGIPHKNIRLLGNMPMIKYTIDAALEVFEEDQICVSTDCDLTIEVVKSLGLSVPFKRPAHLSTDEAGTFEVLKHAYEFYCENFYVPDTIVLLQPTSPFRNAKHLREATGLYGKESDLIVSVKQTKANPYFTLKEEDEAGYLQSSKPNLFTRRQDCPAVYELNGAIYIFSSDILLKSNSIQSELTKKYVMDDYSSIDIDTPLDLYIAEQMLNYNHE